MKYGLRPVGPSSPGSTGKSSVHGPASFSALTSLVGVSPLVSADFSDAAGEEVRSWQGHVLDLVRSEGADKRSTARFLSFGVNGAGLVVMVAVFAHTGGLTGGEVAVAGGTSALGQRLLEAVFGDAAVRALADRARADLLRRVDELVDGPRVRLLEVLAATGVDEEAPARLERAVAAVVAARRATA